MIGTRDRTLEEDDEDDSNVAADDAELLNEVSGSVVGTGIEAEKSTGEIVLQVV